MRDVDLFAAVGPQLRQIYDELDWSATPLGPVTGWSQILRTAVATVLSTRFPTTLIWGTEYVLVYNDAYAELIAEKHPSALGRTVAEVFPEAWDAVGPMLDGVRGGAGATWVEDMPIPLVRRGRLTEAYFTFSYSPVVNSDGVTEGIVDITAETTGTVVSQRRLALLSRLEQALADVLHHEDIARIAVPVLSADAHDFAEVRLTTGAHDGTGAHRGFGDGDDRDDMLVALPIAQPTPAPALHVRPGTEIAPHGDLREFVELVAATLARAWDRVGVHEAEAQLSEALQRSLLTSPATLPGLTVGVRYQPSGAHAHVGGDWFDAFALPDGTAVLVVGDVMGHDRTAAAAMGQIRNLLRGIAHTVVGTPSDVLRAVDRTIASLGVGAIATAVVAHLSTVDGIVRRARWSSAGHPPPLLRRADGRVEQLEGTPNLLLGFDADSPRTDTPVAVGPGDVLLLYSDGLVERRDRPLDEGIAELTRLLGTLPADDIETLCDALLAARGPQAEDDVALVVVRID